MKWKREKKILHKIEMHMNEATQFEQCDDSQLTYSMYMNTRNFIL